jgi:hypothetical protein
VDSPSSGSSATQERSFGITPSSTSTSRIMPPNAGCCSGFWFGGRFFLAVRSPTKGRRQVIWGAGTDGRFLSLAQRYGMGPKPRPAARPPGNRPPRDTARRGGGARRVPHPFFPVLTLGASAPLTGQARRSLFPPHIALCFFRPRRRDSRTSGALRALARCFQGRNEAVHVEIYGPIISACDRVHGNNLESSIR